MKSKIIFTLKFKQVVGDDLSASELNLYLDVSVLLSVVVISFVKGEIHIFEFVT